MISKNIPEIIPPDPSLNREGQGGMGRGWVGKREGRRDGWRDGKGWREGGIEGREGGCMHPSIGGGGGIRGAGSVTTARVLGRALSRLTRPVLVYGAYKQNSQKL
jgi:hypothetical protein